MKKSRKVIVTMLVAVMATAVMAGCGLVKKEIVGTWKASEVEMLGVSVDFAEYAGEELGQSEDSQEWIMEIKSNKTFSMDMMGRTEKGTWDKKDDKYVLKSEESDQEVTVAEDKLVMEQGIAKVTFEKK